MPLYEYKCESCGYVFEVIQKFSDPPLTECPKCGGRLKKILYPPALKFKGTGWYVTDYKNKSSYEDNKSKKEENKKSNNKNTSTPI